MNSSAIKHRENVGAPIVHIPPIAIYPLTFLAVAFEGRAATAMELVPDAPGNSESGDWDPQGRAAAPTLEMENRSCRTCKCVRASMSFWFLVAMRSSIPLNGNADLSPIGLGRNCFMPIRSTPSMTIWTNVKLRGSVSGLSSTNLSSGM